MDKEVLSIVWDLRKRQIKAWWNYWTRWTLIPTAKIIYALQEQYQKGLDDSGISVKTLEILNARLERLEIDVETTNTINKNLLEKVRKYVRFINDYGISQKILEMDTRSRGIRHPILTLSFIEKSEQKIGKSSRSSKEKGKNRRKAH